MISFPDLFLTFLAPRFLKEFYTSFLVDDEGLGEEKGAHAFNRVNKHCNDIKIAEFLREFYVSKMAELKKKNCHFENKKWSYHHIIFMRNRKKLLSGPWMEYEEHINSR